MSGHLDPERLIAIGFSKYEAAAYLALLGSPESTAVEVADRAGVPRQRIYDVLSALHEKGLIEIRQGRPVRHSARPPAAALPAMYQARLRLQARENERIARLMEELIPDLEKAGNGSAEMLARAQRVGEQTVGGL